MYNVKSSQNMKEYRLWKVGNICSISSVNTVSLKDHRHLSQLNHQTKGLQLDGHSLGIRCITGEGDNIGQ